MAQLMLFDERDWYRATEYDAEACEPTGREEFYYSKSIEEAVSFCLATRGLKSRATIGPSRRVVYQGGKAYAITPARDLRRAIA